MKNVSHFRKRQILLQNDIEQVHEHKQINFRGNNLIHLEKEICSLLRLATELKKKGKENIHPEIKRSKRFGIVMGLFSDCNCFSSM